MLLVWQLRRPPRRAAFAALALWVLYLGVFEEEITSLIRRPTMSVEAFDEARAQGRGLRLVSANCAGGQPRAALEAAAYDPDILVLEESPPDQAVADLAAQLFDGSARVAQGPDVAVIARGQVAHIPRRGAWYLTAARVALGSGVTVNIIGAHLTPPVFELGFFSLDYWRAQQRNRKIRREQTQEIAHLAAELAQSGPAILAGDLNCPAGDASLRPLPPLLHDAFSEGGVGWGNTVLNEYPVMRFDQVWCSGELRAVRVRSVRSHTSDHRIVVTDLIWRGSGASAARPRSQSR
jgi:endonuclease/exonuclease/phosphatase family metal-dependent hydrolase